MRPSFCETGEQPNPCWSRPHSLPWMNARTLQSASNSEKKQSASNSEKKQASVNEILAKI